MHKKNVKRMLAVLLSAAMALSPINTLAAGAENVELFRDGTEMEFDDGAEAPEVDVEPIEKGFAEGEELPAITELHVDMTEVTGYYEYGGRNLQSFLQDLNPEITVSFEGDKADEIVHYRDEMEGYGTFGIQKESFTDEVGNISNIGDYSFKIVNTSNSNLASNEIMYHLQSAKGAVPELTEELSFSEGNYNSFYAFQVRNQGFQEREFNIKFNSAVQVKVYDACGEFVEAGSAAYYNLKIPADEIRNIVIIPQDPNMTSLKVFMTVVGGETEAGYALVNTGEHSLNLTAGAVTYTFTAPEDGFYKITSTCDNNVILDEYGKFVPIRGAQRMQKGETRQLQGNNNSENTAQTVTVNIESIPYVTGIEVTDTEERVFLRERQYLPQWDQEAMGEKLLIHLSDGTTIEEIRQFVNVYLSEDLGTIEERVYDKNGNEVGADICRQECGNYEVEFYWEKDPSVVSDKRVPYKIQSITELNCPKLQPTQPVNVTRNYNGMFIAQIPNINKEIIYTIHSSYSPSDISYYGIYELEGDTLIRLESGETFLAEPGKDYYVFVDADNKDITLIDLSIREVGPRIDSIVLKPEYGEKTVVKEFVQAWWIVFADYKFTVNYKDSEIPAETVDFIYDSKYYGRLQVMENEQEGYADFYLSDDPEHHICRVNMNLLHIEEMGSEIVTDITELEKEKELSVYEADGTAYFSFTAPEEGMYSFTGNEGYGIDCIQKQYDWWGESYWWGGAVASKVKMKAGETIYGRIWPGTDADGTASVTVKNITLPAIESIVLVNRDGSEIDNLKCGKTVSGVYRYAGNWFGRKDVFAENLFKVTYETGESEIVETGDSTSRSKYYGDILAFWDYNTKFGDCTVNFGFIDSDVRSRDFTFTIDDERTAALPTFTGAGTYTLDFNYDTYACFVFNPSESGNYRFKVNGGTGGVDYIGNELILTYPRDYNSSTDVNEENVPYGFKTRSKTWMDVTATGEAVCAAISLADCDNITLQIEKISEFKRIELPNLPKNYIEGFGDSLWGIQNVKLHFTEGVKEEFTYGKEESVYYGGMTIRGDANVNGEGSNYKLIASFDDYPELRTIYEANMVPLSEAKLPSVTLGKTDEIVHANYGYENCYQFTAEEAGSYIFNVKADKNGPYLGDELSRVYHISDGKVRRGDSTSPLKLNAGQTVYIEDCYDGKDLYVTVTPGNEITEIKLINGSEKNITGTYIKEFIERWDGTTDARYFDDCEFQVTYNDGQTVIAKYGEAVPGYGEILVRWPHIEGDSDVVVTGAVDIEFAPWRCYDVSCTYPVVIKRAVEAGLAEVKNGKLSFFAGVEDPGNTRYFQYKPEDKSVYVIEFVDSADEEAVVPAAYMKNGSAAAEAAAEQAEIQVGNRVMVAPVRNGSKIFVAADTEEIIYGAYSGEKTGVKITRLENADELYDSLVTERESAKVLYGDTNYQFTDWSFHYGENGTSFGYGDETEFGKVCSQGTDGAELNFAKIGSQEVTFYPERNTGLTACGRLDIVTGEQLGINKIQQESVYNFTNESVYDGNPAAYFDAAEDGFYRFDVVWNSGAVRELEIVNGFNGKAANYSEDMFITTLLVSNYTFISRNGSVKSIKITKIDKNELYDLYEEYKDKQEAEWNISDWTEFQTALTEAKEVLDNGKANQEEVDAAYRKLLALVTPQTTPTPPPVQPTPQPTQPPVQPTPSPTPTPDPEPVPDKNGTIVENNGTVIMADGTTISTGEGSKAPSYDSETGRTTLEEGNEVILSSGNKVTPPAGSVVEKDGSVTEPDGTVIKPDGSAHHTDGSILNYNGTYQRPATAMLEEAVVYATGNQVKAILSDDCAGAEGYDYVISRNKNCTKDKDYYAVSKNIPLTEAGFRYIPKGTWYVYCHAWTRDENGKKVFGLWSNYKTVKVTATTPAVPKIKSVKVKGNKVTVTYTKSRYATGYDIILGTSRKKVLGEYRPLDYGNNVKKVGKDMYAVTFTKVKKGTYYAGLHAYNRTSADGKKVFSPWSDTKKIKVGK